MTIKSGSSTAILDTGEESVTAKVIPFPTQNMSNSGSGSYADRWVEEILGHPDFESKVKEYVENRILDVFVHLKTEQGLKEDSPFDAIYISELTPDSIDRSSIQKIVAMKSIQDLSSELSLNDGWDD